MQKTIHFVLHFNIQKTMHFVLRFYVQKAWQFSLQLYSQKHCTLRYVLISKIYRIVLIRNYKRMYDQSEHIKK